MEAHDAVPSEPKSKVSEVFVARQPIFTTDEEVAAYELLFRAGVDAGAHTPVDGTMATATVITSSFLDIGIEKITGGKRAFINFTREGLLSGSPRLLPPEQIVVELLEDIQPDDEVLGACRQLRQQGYRLALDDVISDEGFEDLIDLADIVKIDFLGTSAEQRLPLVRKLRLSGVTLLAEKVESWSQVEEARGNGYHYLQGFFFSRPTLIAGREVPGFKVNYLQLLEEIHRAEFDFDAIEEIFKREVSLSYRLLRYINSAFFGWRSRIDSIRHALVLLGQRDLKRWVSIVALSGMGRDKADELLVQSIQRAHFCESLAPAAGLGKRSLDLFLMGMFSLIDAFLDEPLAVSLQRISLADDVKRGLLGEENIFREVLDLVRSYERGAWEDFTSRAGRLGLPAGVAPELYLNSLSWALEVFRL